MYLDPTNSFYVMPSEKTSLAIEARVYDGRADTAYAIHNWASGLEHIVSVDKCIAHRGEVVYQDSIHVSVMTAGDSYYEMNLIPGDVLLWDGATFNSMSKRRFLEKYKPIKIPY